MPKFAAIEGLRAWLAWAVVLSHVAQIAGLYTGFWWAAGDAGSGAVSVFIMISGFVICGLVLDKRESWPRYIVRRAFRLFPAYWIAFFAALAAMPLALEAVRHQSWANDPGFAWDDVLRGWTKAMQDHPREQLALHLSLFQGVVPDSVWPWTSGAVLGPAWSLSLEWQFYLIAPALIWLLRNTRWRLVVTALICAGALAFHRDLFGHFNLGSAFPSGGYLFLIGIGSRLAFADLQRLPVAAPFVLVAATIGMLFHDTRGFAIWAALVVFLANGPQWRGGLEGAIGWGLRLLLESAPARYLGARSYSVYILHLPTMELITWQLSQHFALSQLHFALALIVLAVPAVLILSDLLYRIVERPMIQLGARLARSKAAPAPVAA